MEDTVAGHGDILGEVNIKKGNFQGDSCLALLVINSAVNNTE